ncbi:MAG: DNA processing protein [Candidatus Saccharimonadales bacterium]|jgi:DNA processing protein
MKELKLTRPFKDKLDKLPVRVGLLDYRGQDLSSYADMPIVAIVGTRKPTPYGKAMTHKIAQELARAGVVIVSGLAFGVDSLAHDAAIKAGGRAIAVLPCGLDNIYPASHKPLADQIVKNSGTLLSEYGPDHKPWKVEFIERNRIIAALSDVVIIPEAAIRSGSLNTAKHAKSTDTPILVIPGNVTSPMSAGTNQLLKEGAIPITEASDVLKILGIDKKKIQTSLNLTGDNDNETAVLTALALGITDSDSLLKTTGMSPGEFQTTLTMLEISGKIKLNSLGEPTLGI